MFGDVINRYDGAEESFGWTAARSAVRTWAWLLVEVRKTGASAVVHPGG
ncbi:hypothetical protein SALBM135S_02664 [Streptomyces alboniger]